MKIFDIHKIIKYFILLHIFTFSLYPADAKIIKGRVIDGLTHKPLPAAKIMIEKTTLYTMTNAKGFFSLEYPDFLKTLTIISSLKGYYSSILFDLPEDSLNAKIITIEMFPGNEQEFILFHLGNIQVTVDRLLLPEEIETRYKVFANELIHFQALDVSSALELLPGTEVSGQFSLSSVKMPVLRFDFNNSVTNAYSLLGTVIDFDGIMFSNRMNLNNNSFASLQFASSTANQGLDLRYFPIDNVEKVEIYPDVAPAEYGNFTKGIIRIQTRIPPKSKILKINRTAQIIHSSFQSAFYSGNNWMHGVLFTLTRDAKDLRVRDDAYYRLGVQIDSRYSNPNKGMKLKNKIMFSQNLESYEDAGFKIKSDNYTSILGFSTQLQHSFKNKTLWAHMINGNLIIRRDKNERYRVISPSIFSPLLDEGTAIGVLVDQPFIAKSSLNGKEFSLRWKEKLQYKKQFNPFRWNATGGTEWVLEGNMGKGYKMDPLHPPRSLEETRPRTFDELPNQQNIGVYQDNLFIFAQPFRITFGAGIRLDMYNPSFSHYKLQFKNGIFVHPRLRLQLRFNPNFQIRLGYGTTSSPPSLYDLYPRPLYYTILDSSNLAQPVVSTYKLFKNNTHLQGIKEEKMNFSLDFIFSHFLKGTVNFYINNSTNIPGKRLIPYYIPRKFWSDWPDQFSILDSITVLKSSLYDLSNSLWKRDRGIEFSIHFSLKKPFRITSNFILQYQKSTAPYGLMYKYSNIQYLNLNGNQTEIIPFYPEFLIQQKFFSLKNYLHIASPKLGFWITLSNFFFFMNESNSKENLILEPEYYIIHKEKVTKDEFPGTTTDMENFKLNNKQVYEGYYYPFHFYFSFSLTKAITSYLNISFSVNNFLDIHQYYHSQNNLTTQLNPSLNYSMELQANIDKIF